MPCLDAFGLTLESKNGTGAALSLLKNDGASVVVKARCNQDGVIQDFVLKGTAFSMYRQSAAIVTIENLLADNDQGIVIPVRRLSVDGKHTYIAKGFSRGAKTAWSVTVFVPNEPSFDWLEPSSIWTGAHTYSAGALLAKTHIATKKFKARLLETGCEIETAIHARVPQLLRDAVDKTDSKYLERIGCDNNIKERVIEFLNKAACNIENGLHSQSLKPEEVIVHGDFQPGNVLYQGDRACGLIDWDYARLDNPLMDLAYGLLMYAANLSLEEKVSFDTDLAVKFLQGYTDCITAEGHELPVCIPDSDFTPSSRNAHVFSDYLKLSAALIMLWSLSETGQKHRCGVTVGRRALQLIHGI